MVFEELFAFLVGQSPTVVTLVVSGIILYQQQDIRRSIRTLNHNSSTMVKALLAHKLLKPEDVKDVDIQVPSNLDTVNAFYAIFISGVIASGSDKISISKVLVSGDAMVSIRASGKLESVQLRLGRRADVVPVTGLIYTGIIKEYVVEDIFVHGTYQDTGVALSGLRRLVDDSKITVASGFWASGAAGTFNLATPKLAGEEWPMPHEKVAHAQLTWRVQYVL